MIATNASLPMRDLTWTRLTTCASEERLSVRLRFGSPKRASQRRGGVTHYWFTAGELFAVAWWARLSPRKQFACFAVVESLRVGDAGHRLPCVRPAVRVHLFVNTRCVGNDRRAVDRANDLITQIERAGIDPCAVGSAYYHAAGQSLRVGRVPRRLKAVSVLARGRSVSHAT